MPDNTIPIEPDQSSRKLTIDLSVELYERLEEIAAPNPGLSVEDIAASILSDDLNGSVDESDDIALSAYRLKA